MSIEKNRDSFFDASAAILAHEFVLVPRDLSRMMPYYGYSEHTNDLLTGHVAKSELAQRGVELVIDRYKGTTIYRDGNAGLATTDLLATKTVIDEAMLARSHAGLKTRHE